MTPAFFYVFLGQGVFGGVGPGWMMLRTTRFITMGQFVVFGHGVGEGEVDEGLLEAGQEAMISHLGAMERMGSVQFELGTVEAVGVKC